MSLLPPLARQRRRSPPKPLACFELVPAPSYPRRLTGTAPKLARLQRAQGVKMRTRYFLEEHTLGEQTSIVKTYERSVRDGVAETAEQLALERSMREAAAAKDAARLAQQRRRESLARADQIRMANMAEIELAALMQTESEVRRAFCLEVASGKHRLGNVLCENWSAEGRSQKPWLWVPGPKGMRPRPLQVARASGATTARV